MVAEIDFFSLYKNKGCNDEMMLRSVEEPCARQLTMGMDLHGILSLTVQRRILGDNECREIPTGLPNDSGEYQFERLVAAKELACMRVRGMVREVWEACRAVGWKVSSSRSELINVAAVV